LKVILKKDEIIKQEEKMNDSQNFYNIVKDNFNFVLSKILNIQFQLERDSIVANH
jgi:hypothetical protein